VTNAVIIRPNQPLGDRGTTKKLKKNYGDRIKQRHKLYIVTAPTKTDKLC